MVGLAASTGRGCLACGGGSIGGATPSRGEGAGRARQNVRGRNVYVESIAVTAIVKKVLMTTTFMYCTFIHQVIN